MKRPHVISLTMAGIALLAFGAPLCASESGSAVKSRAVVAATTSFTFSTALKNSGILAGATGKVAGKFARVGAVSNQQLAISLVKLTPNISYQLLAFLGIDINATIVSTFTSDSKGKFKITYVKKDGGSIGSAKPLPDVLNPLNNLRELHLATGGQTLLRADVIHADRFSYQFKGPMINTGALPAAAGALQLRATEKSRQFALKVSGLTPSTDFLLAVNINSTLKVTSDSKGKLNLKTLPAGSPGLLDIHTISLANSATGIVILMIKGLGVPPDNTAPSVVSANPADTTANVPTNTKISVAFNKAVISSAITSLNFTVTGPGTTPVSGTVTFDATTNRAIFTPSAALATNVLFTAMLASGIPDFSGNVSASATTWTFTTGLVADITAPFVTTTNPGNGATGIPINRPITATFSETMNAATINAATFTLQQGTTAVSGTLTYSGTTATFTPASNLALSTTYTGTITTAVADLADNEMASTFTWSFTTGAAAAAGPAPIALGAANSFGILAGSTVTSVGPTQINGDLGVSPGSAVTGFPPGNVTGATHAGDGAAAQAKNDLLTAYNDGAGRLGAAVLPGNLGGLTFTPGLYKNSSSTMISGTGSNGILTLDAQGDANAIFIFQMASTLTTDAGTQIVLSGSAKAANIYWQVGSSATLGTSCIFKGNILADQSITLTTGATLEGRALTRIGAVALDSNAVTAPAP